MKKARKARRSQDEFSFEQPETISADLVRSLAPLRPTVVYNTYWRFACVRQEIFFSRLNGVEPPWTSDTILASYKFTNAYRASDRVSQFLIRNVIYKGEQSVREVFFRILLFKLFNKIETWQLLESKFGAISFTEYSYRRYDAVLTEALESGEAIYSGAYIMPTGGKGIRQPRKHQTHLRLLEKLMADHAYDKIAGANRLVEVFQILGSYPMLGNFLAFQYTVDLNYSTIIDFDENQFVIAGPGARSGIRKCFSSLGGLNESDVIKFVTDRQHEEFRRLGLRFQNLWGRDLHLIDCQNLFCEVDKYARVRHPEVGGVASRQRIKQRFKPNREPIEYWFPPKWNLDTSND